MLPVKTVNNMDSSDINSRGGIYTLFLVLLFMNNDFSVNLKYLYKRINNGVTKMALCRLINCNKIIL